MTTTTILTTKACDDCGQVTDYEPLLVGELDLARDLPHLCQACSASRRAVEEAEAAERQRAKREAAWIATVPAKYRNTDLLHPDFPAKLWRGLREWDITRNIGLIGPSGRGKTRVLGLLAKRAIAEDRFVGWCPATSFQWAAQNQWDDAQGGDCKKWLKRWQECAILFLDDLGKHRWTEAVESEFFALVDRRYSDGKPIHWSMNPLPDDEPALVERLQLDAPGVIARALDPTGAGSARPRFGPIVSRLMDETELLPVL
jgi:DNA replication protein DnaC